MNSEKMRGHLALFVAYVIFGLNIPVSRSIIPNVIDPLALSFFRMSGGMILFWILSFFTRYQKVAFKDLVCLFFAAFFALALNQTCFIKGLSLTTPIDASIIPTMLPIISMFLAALILKEPITWRKVIGVVIGLSGTLLLIFSHMNDTGEANHNVWGNLLIMCSVISFSLYLTLFKNLIQRYNSVTLMKWMFLFSTLLSLPISYQSVIQVDFNSFSSNDWLRIGYVVVMATFVSYLLLPIGQKVLRPTTVSMYNYLQPITASLAGVIMGQAVFTFENVLSAALVFIGVYVVTTSKSRADIEAEKSLHS